MCGPSTPKQKGNHKRKPEKKFSSMSNRCVQCMQKSSTPANIKRQLGILKPVENPLS